MEICKKKHRFDEKFMCLPTSQGGSGRHHCAGCAYEKGYRDGKALKEQLDLDLNSLPQSQAGAVRHKSAHAAYAMGYLGGVKDFYKNFQK